MTSNTTRIVVTRHAEEEIRRRGLDENLVRTIVATPDQVLPVRPGRMIHQSRVAMPPHDRVYLVRIVVDVKPDELEVVTAYRTSKIGKYWREDT